MFRSSLTALVLITTTGCLPTEMGVLEALDALGEVGRSGRGLQSTGDVIDVSTDFTIGQALEDAADAIAAFWESQVDCTTVAVDGATVTVDYGTLEDACTYNGRTYAGITTVSVASTAPGALEVEHDWLGFTNGDVTLDGGATVTWDGTDRTRRVETEHTWTDDEGTVDVFGDHLTAPLAEGVPFWESGFTLEGTREWITERGEWTLDTSDLELRLVDPAPQAGNVSLRAPNGKTLAIEYSRVDETTIQAVLVGVRGGDRTYHISLLGQVEEADGEPAATPGS